MQVSARRAAIVAGLIAAVYLAVLFAVRGVPDRVVGLLGGPDGGVARHGGLTLRYRPPEGADLARFQAAIARRGASMQIDAGRIVVEVPGVDEAEAGRVAAYLTHGLEFREALEDTSLLDAARQAFGDELVGVSLDSEGQRGRSGVIAVAGGVSFAIDSWRSELQDERHQVPYLVAERPAELARAFDRLRAAGWTQPAHSAVAFERLDPSFVAGVAREQWRSYLLGDEALLDAEAVAVASRSADPNTGAPCVLLDLTAAGGARFAEVTERLTGKKLATLLGGTVQSAPVINGPIRGGRLMISMGGADLLEQERKADDLVAALSVVSLPPGGVIEDQRWIAPASVATLLLVARIVIALVGGALVALFAGIMIAVTRPVWQPGPRRGAGRFPVKRLLVTLLAPVALVVLGELSLPGVNDVELGHIAMRGGAHQVATTSVGAIGISPVITAFLVVELVTLLTSRWRRARWDPAARIVIGRYVAVLATGFAVLQAYLAVSYLDAPPLDVAILAPGLAVRVAMVASLVTGTMLLVIVAGVIRQHGLGNGYGALLVSAWLIRVVSAALDGPSAGHVLGVATVAAIGIATLAVLRMRVGGQREAQLRVPASALAPLLALPTLLALWSIVELGFPFGLLTGTIVGHPWLAAGAVVALVPIGSFAFSRPGIVAPLAAQTELAPPSRASWRRATLLSLVVLLAAVAVATISAATHPDARLASDVVSVMLFAALVLDVRDGARARRGDLVAVWPLYQAQHAELVRQVLTDAGIECHLASSHLRTLLGGFGPHVPIDVLVPVAAADASRRKIAALFQELPLREVFA